MLLLSHLVAHESADLDVLADFRRRFLDEVADGLLRVSPKLIHESLILDESLDFSFGNSLHDRLRLSTCLRLLLCNSSLDDERVFRNAIAIDCHWSGMGNVKRDLASELLEIIG